MSKTSFILNSCLDDLLAVFLFLDHCIGEVDVLDIEHPHTFLINVCTTTILEVGKVTENIYFSKNIAATKFWMGRGDPKRNGEVFNFVFFSIPP